MQAKYSTGTRALVVAVALICSMLATPRDVIAAGHAEKAASGTSGAKRPKVALRSYVAPNHGRLELLVGPAWKDTIAQAPDDLAPSITFTAHPGSARGVLAAALWSPDGRDWSRQRP